MRALWLSVILLLSTFALPAYAQKQLPGLTEGTDYRYIEDGKPYRPLPAGMVEVAEVFAYSCPHCAHLAPMLEKWKPTLPPSAKLVLVPGVFNRDDPFARAFFAAEAAKAVPVLHPRLFAAVHETEQLSRTATAAQIQAFVGRVQGVNVAAFNKAMQDNTAMLPKLQHAYEFAGRSKIEGTPSLVIAGRYLVLGNSYESLLDNAKRVVLALAPTAKAKPAPKPKAAPAKTAAKSRT